MFLLGRGRAVTLRLKNPPRVRWVSQSLVCRGNDTTAWKKPKDAQEKRRGIPADRDAQGRPIVKAREKSLGAFKPLPVDRLTHELFEPESEGPGRVELDLPALQPRLLSPGVVTSFHHTDPTSPLRVFGVPKKMLVEFRILGVPCSVTTSTTLSIVRALQESISVPSRLILNGRAGCGKSFLLLQAAEYAAATEEWFVFYVPRAQRFVDGSTPYAYSLRTRTYLQLRAARETLRRLGTANEHILEHLYTTEPITLESGEILPEGTPLLDVVDAGQEEEGELNAHVCLEALMAEMGRQTVFPVLIAIDDFQALAGRSLYRDPHGRFIRPHHLGLPRLLLEYASGRKKLARGCVLGALSRTDTQFPVTPQLSESLNLPFDFAPSPRMAGIGKYGASGRWSSQLAQYLDHEVEVGGPAVVEDEFDEYDETEDVAANDQSELIEESEEADDAAEELVDEAAEESTSEFESESEFDEPVLDPDAEMENPWTGWRVYDPPIYEDTYRSTPAVPEPKPKRADEWKERVIADEEDAEVQSSASEEAEADEEAEVVADGEKKTVRALRAIRVPDALSIREAAALFEVWLDTGLLRTGGERRAMRRAEIETMEEYRDLQAAVDEEIPYIPDPVAADEDCVDLFPSVDEITKPNPALITPTAASWKTDTPPPTTATASTATVTDSQDAGPTTSWRESLKTSTTTTTPVSEPSAEDETPVSEQEFLTRRRKTALELESEELAEVKVLEETLQAEKWLQSIDAADKRALSLDQEIDRSMREEEEGFDEEGLLAEEQELLTAEEQELLTAEEQELLTAEEEELLAQEEEELLAVEEEELLAAEEEELLAEEEEMTEEELLAAEEEELLAEEEELFEEDEDDESEADLDEFVSEAMFGEDVDLEMGEDPELAGLLSEGVRHALLDPESVSDLARQPVDNEVRVQEETGADDLFLGKYAESQGNARAFVWGGLIATLQTSG